MRYKQTKKTSKRKKLIAKPLHRTTCGVRALTRNDKKWNILSHSTKLIDYKRIDTKLQLFKQRQEIP